MPFNTLILSCLHHGSSIGEKKARVRVSPKKGERVVFFSIDSDPEREKAIREDLQLEGEICDCVVYFESPTTRCVCFVELKSGKNTDKAVSQLINTAKAFQSAFRKATIGRACPAKEVRWKGYVKTHGCSPTQTKKFKNRLTMFDRAIIKEEEDIGAFLRKP